MSFEWDEAKGLSNKRKHGVSFEEARLVFERGSEYLEFFDEAHSLDEDRFLALGASSGRILLVSWCEPEDGVVRVISARLATKKEVQHYRSWMGGTV